MKKNCAAAIMLLLLPAALPALGGRDAHTVRVTGRVRLAGSSPVTILVISGENREWRIAQKDREKFMRLQQRTVTVEGTEYFIDQTFANGDPAGRQYYLKNIKLLPAAK